MKPILCRLCACFAPGLPRPTKRRMTRHPASRYFFLSPPAGALAPAAGALAPADVGLDILRNVVDRTFEVDGVGDDIDGAAALHAGRGFRVLDVQRHADADGRAFAEPHEVDMQRKIAHRIEMEVARNHAVLLALQIDVVNRGQEPAGQDALAQFGIVDRDGYGGLVVAIDYSGHSPGATLCPCGPLAA